MPFQSNWARELRIASDSLPCKFATDGVTGRFSWRDAYGCFGTWRDSLNTFFIKKKCRRQNSFRQRVYIKRWKRPTFIIINISLSLSPLLSFFFNKNNFKKKYAKNVRLNFLSFPLWNWNDLKWKVAVACAGWPPTWSHRWRWRRHVKLLLRPPRDSPSQLADMFQHVLVKSSG